MTWFAQTLIDSVPWALGYLIGWWARGEGGAMTIRVPRPRWQLEAACRDADVALFFPEQYGSTMAAKQMCATCPVIGPCLDTALADPTLLGIWGGTSERQREQIRRQREGAA